MKMTNQELRQHIETLRASLSRAQAKYAISTNLISVDLIKRNYEPANSEEVAALRVVKACRIKMERLQDRLNHAEGWLESRELLAPRVERGYQGEQVIGNLIRQRLGA